MNITVRKKTTPPSSAPEPKVDNENLISAISDRVLTSFRSEIPRMLSSALHKELSEIKQELLEYRKSIDFLSSSHDDLIKAVERLSSENMQLKKENGSLSSTVLNLSERLNNLEQHLRENNLELNGVPENRSESLPNLVQQCANVIGHKFNDADIVHCTRVAKRDKDSKLPRAIVVKFKSLRCRDEFYSAVFRYNKANPNEKLNTALLGITGHKKPVYVSEHLSPQNKFLHAAARKKAKELKYSFVWIRNGKIYVRKSSDSKYILIRNEKSLELMS
ncbi:uncharacterized protein LOC126967323 [Leptidea sinapis]|uniref:uncharacterized protein LOC126967323 n=1 Tax=Leptidea sinapis TaxID=189913 RepID=UPI0021C27060|nr:uncharacterized protein LOC126967323 [Leptidea sinapis]